MPECGVWEQILSLEATIEQPVMIAYEAVGESKSGSVTNDAIDKDTTRLRNHPLMLLGLPPLSLGNGHFAKDELKQSNREDKK